MIIAIDGPAGSGKSTTAKLVGKRTGYLYIDTGAMYRAMTLKVINNGISVENENGVINLIPNTKISQSIDKESGETLTFLDGADVSKEIRTPEVTAGVSCVCKYKDIRTNLVKLQRDMADKGKVILDGRDIGTVVFPNADLKFYMIADAGVRAQRRYNEFLEKGITGITVEEIQEEIEKRDLADSTREESPLKPAEDAIFIDTTKLSIDEQVESIVRYIEEKK